MSQTTSALKGALNAGIYYINLMVYIALITGVIDPFYNFAEIISQTNLLYF